MTVTIATDSALRANQAGWGTASDGNVWTQPAGTATLSVLSNTLKLTGATGSNNMLLGTAIGASVNALVRFQMSTPGTDLMGLLIRYGTNNARLELGAGSMAVRIAGTIVATTSFTLTANTLYWVRMTASGTTYQVRCWLNGTSEPGTWNLTFTDTTLGAGQVGLYGNIANAANTIQYDSFSAVVTPTLYYVDPAGSDTSTGLDAAHAIQTFTRVKALMALGDIFNFAHGNYTGGVTLTASGTAALPITLTSTLSWKGAPQPVSRGAVIVEPGGAGIGTNLLTINGDYVILDGLEMTGPDAQFGVVLQNNFSSITNCWIHDICNTLSLSPGVGAAGIATYQATYHAWGATISGNRVERVGPKVSGVMQANQYIHNIYVQTDNASAPGTISNNLSILSSGWGIAMYHNPNNWVVTNNTIVKALTGGIDCWGDVGSGYLADHNTIQNNILIECGGVAGWYPAIWSQSDNCGTHNLFRNNLAWYAGQTAIYDNTTHATNPPQTFSNLANADPLFVNYVNDGTGDYHLQATSPAIDAGTATSAPSTDFDRVSRPHGAGYDAGAFEYTPPPSPPPITTGYATYKTVIEPNLVAALSAKNLLGDVQLIGPDTTMASDSWLTSASADLSSTLSGYVRHAFPTGKSDISNDSRETQVRTLVNGIYANDPTNKPIIQGEMGFGFMGPGQQVAGYQYGVEMTDYAVQLARAGIAAMIAYILDDDMHGTEWGFWQITQDTGVPRPWFFCWSLLCSTVLPASTIYAPSDPSTNDFRLLAAQSQQKAWTFVLVNRRTTSQNIQITVPFAPVATSSLLQYVYSQATPLLVDSNGFPLPSGTVQAVLSRGFTVPMAGNSVLILTQQTAQQTTLYDVKRPPLQKRR